ncbi:SIS domain-containing protein [Streptomyces tremellae]|uniref:SIS domain-containing protein n=1 Tax=Streptomyces tremellae TaxID=1124239 RepID=A0ABP7FB73_9ACTN
MAAARTDCSDYPAATGRPDVVVALSQSGRSRETADLVTRFREAGVPTLAVTNAEESPLGEAAEAALTLGGQPDSRTAGQPDSRTAGQPDSRVSTVGFTVTCAALGMLADVVATGAVDDRWRRLPDLMEECAADNAAALAGFAACPLARLPARPRLGGRGGVGAAAHHRGGGRPAAARGPARAVRRLRHPRLPARPMDCASEHTGHVVVGGEREFGLARQLTQKPTGVFAVTEGGAPVPPGVAAVTVPVGLTSVRSALVEVRVLQDLVAEAAAARGNPVDEVAFTREDTKISAPAEL